MKRKDIKKSAKKTLKRSYFRSILVIFIASCIITGGYTFNSSIQDAKTNNNNETTYIKNKTNYDIIKETFEHSTKKKKTKAHGVLAPIVNNVTENHSVILGFLNSFNLMFFKKSISKAVISLIAAIISLLLFIFVRNIIVIGNNRFYLEDRKYKDTGVDKLLFPYKVKKMCHLAGILLMKSVYEFLWGLTIIGGAIKYYEYYMIPYVLAENPSIKRKDAFKLSKELMKGYKWYTFKLGFSMIGWQLLSVFTFGLINLFFTDAYYEHIKAELYMRIRKEKYNELTNKELLNDKLLDDKVSEGKYPMDKFSIPVKEKKKTKKREYYTK
ncbi:MAG: DUF975 family protein [Bacilli bacterium]|nr:DUF975 family protein [Bacilli bacterium]